MPTKWEYASLRVVDQNPTSSEAKVFLFSHDLGVELEPSEFLKDGYSINDWTILRALNQFGSAGWELVGPPVVERMVVDFQEGSTGIPRMFVYHFKRPVVDE